MTPPKSKKQKKGGADVGSRSNAKGGITLHYITFNDNYCHRQAIVGPKQARSATLVFSNKSSEKERQGRSKQA